MKLNPSDYVSIFAAIISSVSLYVSYRVYKFQQHVFDLNLKDRESIFEIRCHKNQLRGGFLEFETYFRNVQGTPAHVRRAYLHFWFYHYQGEHQDEIWNVIHELGRDFISKNGDLPLTGEYALDLSQMIIPTSVKIFGIVEYDDEHGRKWRFQRLISDISIKQYLDEVHKGNPVYEGAHS